VDIEGKIGGEAGKRGSATYPEAPARKFSTKSRATSDFASVISLSSIGCADGGHGKLVDGNGSD
jgi:hypothetical protein